MLTSLKKKIKRKRKEAALKRGSDPGSRSPRRLKRNSLRDSDSSDRSRPSLWSRQTGDRKQTQPNRRTRQRPNVPAKLAEGGLKTDAKGRTLFPVKTKDGQVEYQAAKIELLSGRTLFPVMINGKLKYVPAASDASDAERRLGVFVDEDAITQPSISQTGPVYKDKDQQRLDTVSELDGRGRTLFATERTDPKTNKTTKEYLPTKSEATPRELSQGRYIDDEAIQQPAAQLRQDINQMRWGITSDSRGRTVFAAERIDPKTNQPIQEYLPRKRDATGAELSQGQYIEDEDVQAESIGKEILNRKPRFSLKTWRPLIAIRLEDNSVDYLPRRSQATPKELLQGRYVDDETISRQAQLGIINAMTTGRPRYDRKRDRKLFPIAADGEDDPTALLYAAVRKSDVSRDKQDQTAKVFYLPRESEATEEELAQGFYLPDEVVDEHQRQQRRHTALREDPADMALRRSQRAQRLPAKVNRMSTPKLSR